MSQTTTSAFIIAVTLLPHKINSENENKKLMINFINFDRPKAKGKKAMYRKVTNFCARFIYASCVSQALVA